MHMVSAFTDIYLACPMSFRNFDLHSYLPYLSQYINFLYRKTFCIFNMVLMELLESVLETE